MNKKKTVKKSNAKKSKVKSVKPIVETPTEVNFDDLWRDYSFPRLLERIRESEDKEEANDFVKYIKDSNRFSKVNIALAEKVVKDMFNKVEDPTEVKTRTFTSTTFDDIVAFPKFPSHKIRKEGHHIVRPDFNGPTKFEKDFLNEANNLNEEITSIKNSQDKTESFLESSINNRDKRNKITNRDKVNKANDLFNNLADKVGKITADYWKAKQKLVLANKFMEDFYSGKQFEELAPIEQVDFIQQLQKAVDSFDGEDSDYKKMILNKVRPDKYK